MSVFLEYIWGIGGLDVPSGGSGICGGQGGRIDVLEGIESNLSCSLSISKSNFP